MLKKIKRCEEFKDEDIAKGMDPAKEPWIIEKFIGRPEIDHEGESNERSDI